MKKATEAREKNEQGAELEQIKLCVVNTISKGLNGLVDADTLKSELSGLIDETSRNAIISDKTTWIVTANSGLKYKIKQNGEVTSAEPVEPVEFEQASYEVEKDSTIILKILAKDKSGNETEATNTTFESNKPTIASVNETTGKVEGKTVSDETVTITVNADGKTATCEITVIPATIQATQDNINTATMILADVIGYSANDVEEWQVFYSTEDEVFIISKDVLEVDQILKKYPNDNETENLLSDYENGSGDIADGSYGQIWNADWIAACKESDTAKNTEAGAKTTAYLCDKSKWTRYVMNGMPNTTYAVGGPTLRLLVSSINAKTGNDNNNKLIVEARNGYNRTENFSTTGYGKFPLNWWIASPGNSYNRCAVLNRSSDISFAIYSYTNPEASGGYGIRPLVSTPMQNVRIAGNKVKILK